MKYILKQTVIAAFATLGMLFGFAQTVSAQVVHCTDGGCSEFELACGSTGGATVCLNSRSGLMPTQIDEHRCKVAMAIMNKNCNKDNPQPCIVAEDRMEDRCYYLPLTRCIANPDDIADLLQTHPDVCLGTCDDVIGWQNDPDSYIQPICNTPY